MKGLYEAVLWKRRELGPNDWIVHHDSAPPHKARSVKQLLTQKSITEREHPPFSPDLAPNNFWFFPKIKSALKGRRFHDIGIIQKMWRHWKLFHNKSTSSDRIVGQSV
jgi:histone-lysine N-methyltransferase SETMAR